MSFTMKNFRFWLFRVITIYFPNKGFEVARSRCAEILELLFWTGIFEILIVEKWWTYPDVARDELEPLRVVEKWWTYPDVARDELEPLRVVEKCWTYPDVARDVLPAAVEVAQFWFYHLLVFVTLAHQVNGRVTNVCYLASQLIELHLQGL